MAKKARRSVSSNIYTVMLFISSLALLGAIGYVVLRSFELFDGRLLDTTIG